MRDKLKGMLIAVAAIAVLATGGAALAGAAGGGEDEKPITGAALGKASAAALDHTGGGRVTGTEAGDEEGAYEVEVTLRDGREVDVHLDRDFAVVSELADDERSDDDGDGDQ